MIKKFIKLILNHKITAVLILLALAYGGYWGYKKWTDPSGEIKYILAAAKISTITASVSGSGQISASNQVDIKAKASGDVVYVGAKNGDEVGIGAILLQLDARDARKSVRDAEVNLENAKLSLEKLKLTNSKEKLEENLKKAHEDGFNAISNGFLDFPTIMAGLDDLLFGNTFTSSQTNLNYYSDAVKLYDEKIILYKDDAANAYQTARKAYDQNFTDYKNISRFSGETDIEKLIRQTYDTTKLVAESVKSASNLIQFYKDKLIERSLKPNALTDNHFAALNNYTGKTNSHLTNLLSVKQTIEDKKDAFVNSDLDLKSQELSVKQRENALLDAKEKLPDYFLRAPADGVAAKINFKKGDSVSIGAIAAVFITKLRLAEISLNEVDVAKIKVGQKAVLTFDAVPDLSISGKVAEIDAIGTVSQGVVSYIVKISFDAQDERIKPGMSVSAAIITDIKTNALVVPISAVKSQGGSQYVELENNENAPKRAQVETGLASDEFIEIISGVKEGDQVVAGAISAQTISSQTSPRQSSGGFRIPGLPGQGGSR
ncbi:MAG: efflux RND transporter periplasmic adaptor subunit [Patescibacteria group bacterium]